MHPILIIILACLAISLASALLELGQKRKRRTQIASNWGKTGDQLFRRDSSLSLRNTLRLDLSKEDYDAYIDDQTWSDLNLQDLFEQIDISYSSLGEEYLFSKMRCIHFSEADEFENLKAFLAENPDVRLTAQCLFDDLGKLNSNDAKKLIMSPPDKTISKSKVITLSLLPVLSILLMVWKPALGVSLFAGSFLFNAVCYWFLQTKIEEMLANMGYLLRAVMTARKLAKLSSPLQSSLQKNYLPFKPALAFKRYFIRREGSSELDLLILILNMLFLLPVIGYTLMLDSLRKHQSEALAIYHTLAQLETAISILNYESNLPYFCRPVFQEEAGIHGKELYHPLLSDPVSNDIHLENNIMLSGDNASGKSTYLKAVAISILVSQTLNLAFASEFSLTFGDVSTTVNVEDSIRSGESYFAVESSLIARMLQKVESGRFCYLFFDEIFRGTNSTERISAGLSIIDWLNEKNCLYIMSTHDMKLVDLASPFTRNYHFETRYEDGTIIFDYLLKEGRAQTSNAIKMLAYLDFPKEIITKANSYMAKLEEDNRNN